MASVETKRFFQNHLAEYPIQDRDLEPVPINKKYVHKKLAKNIVITMPNPLSLERERFRSRIVVANDNDFFFDHDLRHIPGMLIVEAVRQIAVAITHAHFEIPLQDRFLINEVDTRFFRLANKQDPTYLDGIICKAMIRNDIVHYMRGECYIHQNGHLCALASGVWSTVTNDIFTQLEENIPRRQFPAGVMVNAVQQI